jgi:RNA polymerase sigma-70 factor (ECF subfamily)
VARPDDEVPGVAPLVDRLFRDEAARLIALLTRLLGPAHLALAEDVTQEAFIAALRKWPHDGVPANPSAWLLQVARRKALDAIRRERSLEAKVPEVAAELERVVVGAGEDAHGHLDAAGGSGDAFADDRLRMILLCCHPAVSADSRVALTLRLASGLSVGEIARAFLADEPAIAQRLVRAKRALRDAGASFDMPEGDALVARLDSVHAVLYLMFNEGHTAHEGDALLRRDLCEEALRLVERLTGDPATRTPAGHALAALFAFHASRLDARTDANGDFVTLRAQDRTRWDEALIARGFQHLERAAVGDRLTPFHLEAHIASLHAMSPAWESTDWARIVDAYDALLAITRSPVTALNRTVALRELHGAEVALREVETLRRDGALDDYHLLHAVHAELLTEVGRGAEATGAWKRARDLTRSAPTQRHIAQRLQSLSSTDVETARPHPS